MNYARTKWPAKSAIVGERRSTVNYLIKSQTLLPNWSHFVCLPGPVRPRCDDQIDGANAVLLPHESAMRGRDGGCVKISHVCIRAKRTPESSTCKIQQKGKREPLKISDMKICKWKESCLFVTRPRSLGWGKSETSLKLSF